jgi:uncharacterized membrane protein
MNVSTIRSVRALLALCLLAAAQVSFAAAVKFYAAGQIAGGDLASQARDAKLLPNGRLLMVGTISLFPDSVPAGDTSAQWTPEAGWQLLADPFPSNTSASFVTGRAISDDGRVIGGSQHAEATGALRNACLWTNHGSTVQMLPFFPGAVGHPNVGLNSLTADGSIGYGFDRDTIGIACFRYTAQGGLVKIDYLHADDSFSTPAAHGISADGRVMVGTSTGGASLLGAFRYDYTGVGPSQGTLTQLPALPGGTTTTTLIITPDATTIYGTSDSPDFPNGQFVRWRNGGAAEALGMPTTDPIMTPNNLAGVTDDGSAMVVSVGLADGSNMTAHVFNRHGWSDLQPALARGGAKLDGWVIDAVLGCSNNGRVLYGSGQHNGQQEAWVAVVPPGFLRSAGAGNNGGDDASDD